VSDILGNIFVSGFSGLAVAVAVFVFLKKRLEKYLDGYLGEKGKTLARREDIEELKKEVQILTKETETIKAQIADQVWDRQMRWQQKRDMYHRLLESIGQLMNEQQEASFQWRMQKSSLKGQAKLLEDGIRSLDRLEQAQQTLFRASDVAPLYICQDALAVLPKIFDLAVKPNSESDCFPQESDRYIEHLKGIKARLQTIAKNDLNLITDSPFNPDAQHNPDKPT
jgi:hypothetical protein